MGIPVISAFPTLLHGTTARFQRTDWGDWKPEPAALQEEKDKFNAHLDAVIEQLIRRRQARLDAPANLPMRWQPDTPFPPPYTPPVRKFLIERHPKRPSEDVAGVDDYPWFVEEVTNYTDSDDYGRMRSHSDAVALVTQMLKGQRYAPAS